MRPNAPFYEGIIVGIHSRDNDLVVNATRAKKLTNFRVSGKDDAMKTTPPIDATPEYAVEFIEEDELVEIPPKSVRLRKRHLSASGLVAELAHSSFWRVCGVPKTANKCRTLRPDLSRRSREIATHLRAACARTYGLKHRCYC